MSFIQRELERIQGVLVGVGTDDPQYDQLYAAQQALAWALEPSGFKRPSETIMGTLASSEGCHGSCDPAPS